VIPFEEIDARLEQLGLNRAWLAETTSRSAGAIRSALAPSASAQHRSEKLQQVLSDAIEREELSRQSKVMLPERISIEATKEDFESWCRAYKASPHDTLEDWSVEALNKAADEWHRRQSTTYRDLKPLPPAMVAEDDGEKTSETA
jgi:hypothetical protein